MIGLSLSDNHLNGLIIINREKVMTLLNIKKRQIGGLFVFIAALFILSGCYSSTKLNDAIADAQSPETIKAYENKIKLVAKAVDGNPSYKRIPLDTREDQEWFATESFLYWDNKSSKEEFINNGIKRFPGYKSSFEFLAEKLKK